MSDDSHESAEESVDSAELKRKLTREIRSQRDQIESLNEQISHLRENAVHLAAVEQVLADSELSDDRVPELLDAIEATDSELWSDEFEWGSA